MSKSFTSHVKFFQDFEVNGYETQKPEIVPKQLESLRALVLDALDVRLLDCGSVANTFLVTRKTNKSVIKFFHNKHLYMNEKFAYVMLQSLEIAELLSYNDENNYLDVEFLEGYQKNLNLEQLHSIVEFITGVHLTIKDNGEVLELPKLEAKFDNPPMNKIIRAVLRKDKDAYQCCIGDHKPEHYRFSKEDKGLKRIDLESINFTVPFVFDFFFLKNLDLDNIINSSSIDDLIKTYHSVFEINGATSTLDRNLLDEVAIIMGMKSFLAFLEGEGECNI